MGKHSNILPHQNGSKIRWRRFKRKKQISKCKVLTTQSRNKIYTKELISARNRKMSTRDRYQIHFNQRKATVRYVSGLRCPWTKAKVTVGTWTSLSRHLKQKFLLRLSNFIQKSKGNVIKDRRANESEALLANYLVCHLITIA